MVNLVFAFTRKKNICLDMIRVLINYNNIRKDVNTDTRLGSFDYYSK